MGQSRWDRDSALYLLQVHGLLNCILPQLFTAPGFEGLCNARPRLLRYTEYKRCLAADLAVMAGGAVAAAALVAMTGFKLAQHRLSKS